MHIARNLSQVVGRLARQSFHHLVKWAARGLNPGPGWVGLVPAVLVVALALAMMLWVLPAQETAAHSRLQPVGMPATANVGATRLR
jgi:hypothetical protein